MDNMVPKNILLRLSNDDEKAFEFIYWKYNAHVYNFANSLLYSPKIAQDITQNVFLKIWENCCLNNHSGNCRKRRMFSI